MVVLCLLTLFAIVGIAFVFYADAEATSARVAREAETLSAYGSVVWNSSGNGGGTGNTADIDPYTALSVSSSARLSTTLRTAPGAAVAVAVAAARAAVSLAAAVSPRGCAGRASAAHLYGWNDSQPYPNDKAFIGSGRPHFPSVFNAQAGGSFAADDAFLMNFQYFASDGFLRDPEHFGTRANPAAQRTAPYTGGFNVPCTYPDYQNFYPGHAASHRWHDPGAVLPSSLAVQPGKALNDSTNPNWTNTYGKYLTLRPRPADMGPGFPYPSDPTGDVKNLDWAPGGNDSIWIDPVPPS